jgi:hypothetical protein
MACQFRMMLTQSEPLIWHTIKEFKYPSGSPLFQPLLDSTSHERFINIVCPVMARSSRHAKVSRFDSAGSFYNGLKAIHLPASIVIVGE